MPEPYHVFPSHGTTNLDFLSIFVLLPSVGLAAWFHYRSEPDFVGSLDGRSHCRVVLRYVSCVYVLPVGILLLPILLQSAGQPDAALGMAVFAAIVEVAVSCYLYQRS